MDTALKQRLVGASVLIALAVIFLPMLIKGPAPESGASDVPLNLPEAPQGEFETRELPLVTPGGSTPAPVTAASAAGQPAAGAVAQPTGTALHAGTAGGQYAVGFGSYATAGDAGRVVAALRASQLPGYHEPVPAGGRTLHRVRIGPYATQAEAESARLRATHVSDRVNAKVVVLDAPASSTAAPASVSQPLAAAPTPAAATAPLPATRPAATAPAPDATTAPKRAAGPTAPASAAGGAATPAPVAAPSRAPTPAASNVGFAVQLGAFGNAEEANRLRDRARAAGFSAFVEQVRTDKGTLSRVRVGPVADRADADRLRDQVSAKLGVPGIVRPHP